MLTTLQGDSRAILPTLEAESVHACITSPPYWNLRRYDAGPGEIGQEKSPDEYIAALVEVFRGVRRVLRGDGVCLVNLGDSYAASGRGGGGKQDTNKGSIGLDAIKPPPGYKEKDLLLLPFRVALALQGDGWFVRSVMPWIKANCLSGGTVVYARTQKGDMPTMIKDLVRLRPDTVQLWNGERWTQVLSFTENPRPDRPLELELRNGQRIGCTPEHLWPTCRGNITAADLRIGDVIQTCTLPEPREPCEPDCLPFNDIGWLIGMYLAEGSKIGDIGLSFASHADEVPERAGRLSEIAARYGGTCNPYVFDGHKAVINVFSRVLRAIVDTYLSGDDAATKHLTTAAWQRSNKFLQAVLHGYLDGDGHYDELNDRWRLGFCNNDVLASDLRTIGARLGIRVRLRRCKLTNQSGKVFPSWRGELRFHVGRDAHLKRSSTSWQPKPDSEIVAIRASRARKFWDIAVADEPHLFTLASGVLTHNCMPESVTDRPTTAHEYWFMLTRQPRYFWDGEAVRQGAVKGSANAGARNYRVGAENGRKYEGQSEQEQLAGRNFRTSDPWRTSLDLAIEDTRAHLAHLEAIKARGGLLLDEDGDPLALQVTTSGYAGAHYATFPPKLIEPLLLASAPRECCSVCGAAWVRQTKPSEQYEAALRAARGKGDWYTRADTTVKSNQHDQRATAEYITTGFAPSCPHVDAPTMPGVVLDPFAGSGTTGQVALKHGRRAVLIELSADYVDQHISERTNGVQVTLPLE